MHASAAPPPTNAPVATSPCVRACWRSVTPRGSEQRFVAASQYEAFASEYSPIDTSANTVPVATASTPAPPSTTALLRCQLQDAKPVAACAGASCAAGGGGAGAGASLGTESDTSDPSSR